MTPIEKIRCLTKNSNDLMLDKIPCRENDIFDVLWMLVGKNSEEYIYTDVPVWAICAFTHLNFSYPGTSWRDLLYSSSDGLMPGVTGEGWTNNVFDYFDSDLKEAWFPAASSNYGLKLHSYGNLVSVTNGVHRAIGAINYLVATQGSEKAVLKKASVTYQSIDKELIDLLKKLYDDDCDLWISRVRERDIEYGIYVLGINANKALQFHYRSKVITPLKKWMPLTRKYMELGRNIGFFKRWHLICKDHLWIITRDNWRS